MRKKCANKVLLSTKIVSPLRYPGGKGRLTNFFTALLATNNCKDIVYYEPFAGGAGAALQLLSTKVVNEIWINDADPCIYAFWYSILNDTNRFVDKLWNTSITIKEWQKQKSICVNLNSYSIFEIGFATFFLNRCNHSGILIGSGPIGGYEQKGKWKLNARFNKKTLANRITNIGQMSEQINVSNEDAINFLISRLPRGNRRKKSFVYLDPPYLSAGRRLYLSYYEKKDHRYLANYLQRQKNVNWLVTYDNNAFIREIYKTCKEFLFSLRYSLQNKQIAQELLVIPPHIEMPNFSSPFGGNMAIQVLN